MGFRYSTQRKLFGEPKIVIKAMSSAQGRLVKILIVTVVVLLVLWTGHTLDAAPRAYHYFSRPKQPTSSTEGSSTPTQDTSVFYEGQSITDIEAADFLDAVLRDAGASTDRLECPGEREFHPRYQALRRIESPGIQYMFSVDLYQSMPIINRLMTSIIKAIQVLGPERCSLSIVEGRSTDGTFTVLEHLTNFLADLGVKYWLHQSSIDPMDKGRDRIEGLANLRNQAIQPLLTGDNGFVANPQIIFLNDIMVCPDDILELVYQHKLQNATQTCAMDWIEQGKWFYDVWVSRSMTGNIFFEVPSSGEWTYVENLFYDDPFTKKRFENAEPFQVFSCWGGMTVLEAAPFQNSNLTFRRNVEGECYGGEPQLLGMDLAKLNISKVQTIPSVNVGYDNNESGLSVKQRRGYLHEKVNVAKQITRFEEDTDTRRVHWKPPPCKIRCMPETGEMTWVDAWYDPNKKEEE